MYVLVVCLMLLCVCSQGFEPRGTYIGLRQSSLEKLLENTGPGRTLSVVPQLSTYRDTGRYRKNRIISNRKLISRAFPYTGVSPFHVPVAEKRAKVYFSPSLTLGLCN